MLSSVTKLVPVVKQLPLPDVVSVSISEATMASNGNQISSSSRAKAAAQDRAKKEEDNEK